MLVVWTENQTVKGGYSATDKKAHPVLNQG